MPTTRFFLTVFLLMFFSQNLLAADDASATQDRTAIAQADLAARKKLIRNNLPLSETEAHAFWRLYDAYEKQLTQLSKRRSANLGRLGADFEAMTDEKAAKYVRENLEMQRDRLKIMSQYFKEIGQILPGKKLARYYQIEYQIRAIIDAKISESIPLIK
jgi:hypothetical protein